MDIIDVRSFDYSIIKNTAIQPRPKGNQGGRKKIYYKNLVCAFDIETSAIEEINQSVMYIWQFRVDDIVTVIGKIGRAHV